MSRSVPGWRLSPARRPEVTEKANASFTGAYVPWNPLASDPASAGVKTLCSIGDLVDHRFHLSSFQSRASRLPTLSSSLTRTAAPPSDRSAPPGGRGSSRPGGLQRTIMRVPEKRGRVTDAGTMEHPRHESGNHPRADQACAKTRQCQYRAFSCDQDQHQRFAVSVSQGIRPAPFNEA
jgi:hypothetical protein